MADADPPRWFEPMAATLAPDARMPGGGDDGWLFEPKLDGVRILAWVVDGEVSLLSRNRIHQEDVYPEVVDGLAEAVAVDAVVDGEVVAYDADGRASFGRLQQRMHVHSEARSRRSPVRVTFVAFDLLWVAGRDVRDLPLRDRKALLARVVEPGNDIELIEALEGDGATLVERARDEGWEGLIAKRVASRYQGRRSRDWLKLKVVRQQEMVVVGWTPPSGSRVAIGALLLGYHDDGRLRYGGKVGTGFTEPVLRDLRGRLEAIEVDAPPVVDPPREKGARWVRPALVAQVGFGEWSADGRLRHPRYLGLRTDKDPADVVREG
ncbi:MAG TPA: non-homologous end-joining DNA ligase [Iamia sp.]|nr:non-homologous end-joining DNA ligase [Iamia sp.]